jgi:hypothetical protein
VPCADFAPGANGAFVDRAIISLHRPTTLRGGRRGGWAVSPARRRRMETDMNDFGRRAGGEALQFGPAWAGIFRARSRGRGDRRPRTCVCHSELAAGVNSRCELIFRSSVRIARRASWNPIRQVLARYLDKWTRNPTTWAKAAPAAVDKHPLWCLRRGCVHVFHSGLPWNSNRFAVEPAASALLLTSSAIQMPFSAAVS